MRFLVLIGLFLVASLGSSAQDGIVRNLLIRGSNTTAANVATITVPALAGPLTFTLPPNGGELLVSSATTNGQMNNLALQGTLTLNGLTGPGVLTVNASEQVVNLSASNGQLLQWVGGVPTFQDVATVLGGTAWLLAGNAITDASVQFAGTTSNHPFAFRSNNVERLRLNTNGSIQRVADGDARGTNATDLQVERTAVNQVASGNYSVIGGGRANRSTGIYATIGGGESNIATADRSTVGGGSSNQATLAWATVGGGQGNQATGERSTVGGGLDNQATFPWATVSGGQNNRATNERSTVGGGFDNQASGEGSTVGGGSANVASGLNSTVDGGLNNIASGSGSSVSGGVGNTSSSTNSVVSGGQNNQASSNFAVVGGGFGNQASAAFAVVSGGSGNVASGQYSGVPSGIGLFARSSSETVAGSFNTDYTPTSTSADRLFVLGNGTSNALRSDALVVYKNGAVAFGSAASTGLAGHILVSQGASAPPQWQLVETALGGAAVLYGVAAPQTTVGNGAEHLFNLEYSGTVTVAAVGARISSVTNGGSAPNANATGLTIGATSNGTGTATALSVGASGGATNVAVDVTAGSVNTAASSVINAGGIVNTNGRLNVNNIEVHAPPGIVAANATAGDVVLPAFSSRYVKIDVTNTTAATPRDVTFPVGVDGQRLTTRINVVNVAAGSTVTFVNTRVTDAGAAGTATDAQSGQVFLNEWIYDTEFVPAVWVLLSSIRID